VCSEVDGLGMRRNSRRSSLRTQIVAIVPSIAGWRTYPRALANLLLFGLVALAGEWLVHQLEYLIEYGHRYGTVMGSTPHRFYMAPLGAALGTIAAALLTLAALTLRLARIKRRRLLRRLPSRLARHVPTLSLHFPARSVAKTGLVLAGCQAALYLLQENLERVAVSGGMPGLWVLLAPQHATAVPLHILVAICASWLLWTVAARIRQSHAAIRVARILVALVVAGDTVAPRLMPGRAHVPNLRLVAGILCLRSPPLTA